MVSQIKSDFKFGHYYYLQHALCQSSAEKLSRSVPMLLLIITLLWHMAHSIWHSTLNVNMMYIVRHRAVKVLKGLTNKWESYLCLQEQELHSCLQSIPQPLKQECHLLCLDISHLEITLTIRWGKKTQECEKSIQEIHVLDKFCQKVQLLWKVLLKLGKFFSSSVMISEFQCHLFLSGDDLQKGWLDNSTNICFSKILLMQPASSCCGLDVPFNVKF